MPHLDLVERVLPHAKNQPHLASCGWETIIQLVLAQMLSLFVAIGENQGQVLTDAADGA
jgi:hypothetical protein